MTWPLIPPSFLPSPGCCARGAREPSHMSPEGFYWKKGEGLFTCHSRCEVKTKLILTGSKLRYPSPQGHPCDLQTDSTLSLVPGSGQALARIFLASSESSLAHSWAPGFWLEDHESHFLFLIPGWVAWVPQPWKLGGLVMPARMKTSMISSRSFLGNMGFGRP